MKTFSKEHSHFHALLFFTRYRLDGQKWHFKLECSSEDKIGRFYQTAESFWFFFSWKQTNFYYWHILITLIFNVNKNGPNFWPSILKRKKGQNIIRDVFIGKTYQISRTIRIITFGHVSGIYKRSYWRATRLSSTVSRATSFNDKIVIKGIIINAPSERIWTHFVFATTAGIKDQV